MPRNIWIETHISIRQPKELFKIVIYELRVASISSLSVYET